MRIASVLACALLAACFSKPANNTGGGGGDGGVDAPPGDGVDAPPDGPPIDPSSPLRIAAGGRHACRLDAMNRIVCWGSQDHGQLGVRNPPVQFPNWTGIPAPANTDTGWTSLTTGRQHTCGVRMGMVYCWGENFHRQSAPGSSLDDVNKTAVMLPQNVMAERVYAGGFTTCAIAVDHTAYCWGDLNFNVQHSATHPSVPVRLGTTTYSQIAIADDHACAITDAGAMHCWGEAEQLQTGREGDTADVLFTSVGPISMASERFTQVAASHEVTCAIATDKRLICWGSANQGQLGNLASGGHHFEVIQPTIQWKAVAVGTHHTCAVTDGGVVHCWGDDYFGALGNGTFNSSRDFLGPVDVGMLVGQIVANDGYTCALATDGGTLKCWGTNEKGELGNAKYARKIPPTRVRLPVAAMTVRSITAGDDHTCALDASANPSAAYCWGLNDDRQIGSMSSVALHAIPELALNGMLFSQISAGGHHTCGIINSGANIYCWGSNYSYQLGAQVTSQTENMLSPPSGTWTYVAAGSTMSCGITSVGELVCWGTRPNRLANSPPTNYGKAGTWEWRSISIGSDFAVGVVTDVGAGQQHLYSFATTGKACAALLPSNLSATQLATPQEILSGIIPSAVTAFPRVAAAHKNGGHTCVHYLDHTTSTPRVGCFGASNSGQLGGSATCGTPPTMNNVSGTWPALDTTNPTTSAIFTSNSHSCALDTANHIICWGGESNFELGGMNPGTNPTTVEGTKMWSTITGGFTHTCGVDDAGVAWCWGGNEYGQVGDDSSYEPSPVTSAGP